MTRYCISSIGLAALLIFGSAGITAAGVYAIDLYNNTAHPIELRTGSTWATIRPGRSKGVAYSGGLTIKVDGRQLHFDRVDPPKEYTRGGLFSVTLKAQLDSDLKIWLLPPSAQWPLLDLSNQPAGFPLSAK